METLGHKRSASAIALTTWLTKTLARPQVWPEGALSIPRWQAHRGYCQQGCQENTLAAFRAALQNGAEMIELDVRLSKDLIPVVFHDENLSRLGRPSGSSDLVQDLDFLEIQKRTGAPSLEQVLLSLDIPQKINIELKTSRIIDEPLERKVLQVIEKTQAWDRVLISSFNPFSLWRMSLMTERLPLALLVAEDLDYLFLREMWLLPFLKFHVLHLSENMATDEVLQFWRNKGVPVAVWTVNDPQKATALLEKGCLSIISDQVIN